MRFVPLLFVLLYSCQAPPPPNIILIMADDLGYETLGCNGGTSYATPNLDAMARDGMRFTQCYATPLCTPSRVQIMTGRYNFRNYIGFGLLDPGEVTFGHLLKEAGYTTGIAGKWQLYGNAHQRELAGRGGSRPEQAGFDSYCLWQVEDHGFRYKSPRLEHSDTGLQNYAEAYGPDLFREYITDFLQENQHKPFFLYYPMCLTHDPFLPSPDHPDYATYDPESRINDTTYFRDMLAYTDKIVGQILDQVHSLDLAENTLVIFLGDNGTDRDVISRMGNQVIRGHKGYPTSAGTHVPMITYWPGHIKQGSESNQLVDFTDFLPTLMEVSGGQLPEAIDEDGHSLLTEFTHQKGSGRQWVYCDYNPQWGHFTPSRMVHDESWKLYDDGRFFQFSEDFLEAHPLADSQLTTSQLQLKHHFQTILNQYASTQ